MAKRNQLGGQLEGGVAHSDRPSLPLRLNGPDLSIPASTSAQAARLHAMQALAEILVSIFRELSPEEQAKYRVRASGNEPQVV
jgi:hypothetical protein